MSQPAAPANNPSAMHYPWLLIGLHPDHRAANRWVVRGSRLFSHVSAGLMMRRKLRGGEIRAKATPSKPRACDAAVFARRTRTNYDSSPLKILPAINTMPSLESKDG
jgi:hypothetical protein